MVEVFRTTVKKAKEANLLIERLESYFPGSRINFDLDDCDKVLRVEAESVAVDQVIGLLNDVGFSCSVLE
jgi:hypothetical protein